VAGERGGGTPTDGYQIGTATFIEGEAATKILEISKRTTTGSGCSDMGGKC